MFVNMMPEAYLYRGLKNYSILFWGFLFKVIV